MSDRRRQKAERFVARDGDVTIHRPAGAEAIPGIERQTTGVDEPADRAQRPRRGVGLGDLREHRGLTQTALADRLGMRQGALNNLERRANPTLSTIARYLRGLDERADVQLVVRYGDGRTDTMPVPTAAEGD